MPLVLVVVTASPYGSDVAYHALRLSLAFVEAGAEVTVFLMADGTGAAIDASSAEPDKNLGSRLRGLIDAGAQVKVCGLCLETRGYHSAPLVEGVALGTMPELAALALASDRVLTF